MQLTSHANAAVVVAICMVFAVACTPDAAVAANEKTGLRPSGTEEAVVVAFRSRPSPTACTRTA